MVLNSCVTGLFVSLMLVLLSYEGETASSIPLVNSVLQPSQKSYGYGYGSYQTYGKAPGGSRGGYYNMPPPPPRWNEYRGWSGMLGRNDKGNQCNAQWRNALLAEALNYNNWKCSTRIAADGSTQPCVLTGPVTPGGPVQAIITGCGWIMPTFCDNTINDVVNSLLASTPSIAPPPPVGYMLTSGVAYYKVHTELKSWADAKAICAAEGVGTHLAVPTSTTDYTALMGLLDAALPGNPGMWTGISDIAVEGSFESVTGQPGCMLNMVFLPAPANGGAGENCIQLGFTHAMGLNDYGCANLLPFICEQSLPGRMTPCRA